MKISFFAGDRDTEICGGASINCYQNAEKNLYGEDIIDEFTNDTVKLYREFCNCLPSCTQIKYEAYIDRTKFDYERMMKSYGYSGSQE